MWQHAPKPPLEHGRQGAANDTSPSRLKLVGIRRTPYGRARVRAAVAAAVTVAAAAATSCCHWRCGSMSRACAYPDGDPHASRTVNT
jgi:phosphodiesterase/alkaline phosphatase D-like protein